MIFLKLLMFFCIIGIFLILNNKIKDIEDDKSESKVPGHSHPPAPGASADSPPSLAGIDEKISKLIDTKITKIEDAAAARIVSSGGNIFRNTSAAELGYEIHPVTGKIDFNNDVNFNNSVDFNNDMTVSNNTAVFNQGIQTLGDPNLIYNSSVFNDEVLHLNSVNFKSTIKTKIGDTKTYVDTLPQGTILAYNKAELPYGWKKCDGKKYEWKDLDIKECSGRSCTTSGYTEFQTPDLSGRFILGEGNGIDLTRRTVGDTGGSQKSLLHHRHYFTSNNKGQAPKTKGQDYRDPFLQNIKARHYSDSDGYEIKADYMDEDEINHWFTGDPSIHQGGCSGARAGGTKKGCDGDMEQYSTDDTMPPYYVLYYIIKVLP